LGLTLSFKAGGDFYADDERFIVLKIRSPIAFTIKRVRDGVEFECFEEGPSREIAPNVMAAVNLKRHGGLARVHLSAPRSVRLTTGENYRSRLRPPDRRHEDVAK
jgi:hypothetical protein